MKSVKDKNEPASLRDQLKAIGTTRRPTHRPGQYLRRPATAEQIRKVMDELSEKFPQYPITEQDARGVLWLRNAWQENGITQEELDRQIKLMVDAAKKGKGPYMAIDSLPPGLANQDRKDRKSKPSGPRPRNGNGRSPYRRDRSDVRVREITATAPLNVPTGTVSLGHHHGMEEDCRMRAIRGCKSILKDGGVDGSGFCKLCHYPSIEQDYQRFRNYRDEGYPANQAALMSGFIDPPGDEY